MAARENFKGTPFASVDIQRKDFRKLEGPFPNVVIVTNPPYGVRLEPGDEIALHKLYEDFGYFSKTKCPASRAIVVIADPSIEKDIWFKPVKWLMFDNGGLEVRANLYTCETKSPKRN